MFIVLRIDLGDHELVISDATVFQDDSEHFPKSGDQAMLELGMLNHLVDHLVETYRVNE